MPLDLKQTYQAFMRRFPVARQYKQLLPLVSLSYDVGHGYCLVVVPQRFNHNLRRFEERQDQGYVLWGPAIQDVLVYMAACWSLTYHQDILESDAVAIVEAEERARQAAFDNLVPFEAVS